MFQIVFGHGCSKNNPVSNPNLKNCKYLFCGCDKGVRHDPNNFACAISVYDIYKRMKNEHLNNMCKQDVVV